MSQDREQWRRKDNRVVCGHLLSPTVIDDGRLVSEWLTDILCSVLATNLFCHLQL